MHTYQTQNEPVDGDNIVFPDNVINSIHTFVDVWPTGWISYLKHEIIAKFSQMRR